MSSVSWHGVNKWYRNGLHALRDIDLAVGDSETVVVCGPSGSGKSTLIRTAAGLEAIDEGAIRIEDGHGTAGQVATVQRQGRIGMVFQQFNLFTHFLIIDNLTLAYEHHTRATRAEAEARAMGLLERVGLADQAQKYPGQLSGGQQQRAAIARALMLDPQILLFDEPTSALDPEMVAEVLSLMEELAREGRTTVCVTHEMGFARRIADRIVFMAEGSIHEVAPPDDFFAHPSTASARDFLDKLL